VIPQPIYQKYVDPISGEVVIEQFHQLSEDDDFGEWVVLDIPWKEPHKVVKPPKFKDPVLGQNVPEQQKAAARIRARAGVPELIIGAGGLNVW
jgi:hypothetical protein